MKANELTIGDRPIFKGERVTVIKFTEDRRVVIKTSSGETLPVKPGNLRWEAGWAGPGFTRKNAESANADSSRDESDNASGDV